MINKIKSTILLLESLIASLFLSMNRVKLGSGVKIKGIPLVRNRGEFVINSNVRINSRISANPIGGNTKCYFVIGKDAELIMKTGVAISNSAINCYNSVVLEENVMIGGNCCIYDTDFHPLKSDLRNNDNKSAIITKPILIKKNAFIGGHSIILKGVTIGENSIIGAGSVVSKDIPDNEIWAGNPASFIRKI